MARGAVGFQVGEGARGSSAGLREGHAKLISMPHSVRDFQAGPDPFDRMWHVTFKWLQTGISIRHADTVDVKFLLYTEGEERSEKVIAMEHAALLDLSAKTGQPLTDPWCMKLAAMHLRHMIETGEDMEKALVTIPPAEMERYAEELRQAVAF